jgi:cytochrome c oxidase subunit 1
MHFWVTFLGTYLIYFPMHYLGFEGMPRRYYAYEGYEFISDSAQGLNEYISIVAILVGVLQLIFLINMIASLKFGKKASANPWNATTLEWQTEQTPPAHGNWGDKLPVVYRWAYEYSVPGMERDFVPQNEPDTAQSDSDPSSDRGEPQGVPV